MNPHAMQPTSLTSIFRSVWLHRQLIKKMAWREVIGRYKGSVFGLIWSFIYPILMLAVYTFVFSIVFEARWDTGEETNKVSFALVLFVGLIVHGLFAEVINQSPRLIVDNSNYVKKVMFPLEILPLVSVFSALFHSSLSLVVLLIASLFVNLYLPWTMLLIPFVLLPLIILIAGLSWILASLGVFIRDVGQLTGVITTMMLFLAPIFYPLSALPQKYHPFILANPLSFIIEQARSVLIFGDSPDWPGLGVYMLCAMVVAWLGYAWFQRTRKGFADVI